ncbi:MAG: hypothetical protein QM692_22005 [Thermomicrobiales bacterium]
MASLEDLQDQGDVAVAVAATAVLLSPPVRKLIRRGAAYGLAGILIAGDAVASFGRGAARGIRQAAAEGDAPLALAEAASSDVTP